LIGGASRQVGPTGTITTVSYVSFARLNRRRLTSMFPGWLWLLAFHL